MNYKHNITSFCLEIRSRKLDETFKGTITVTYEIQIQSAKLFSWSLQHLWLLHCLALLLAQGFTNGTIPKSFGFNNQDYCFVCVTWATKLWIKRELMNFVNVHINSASSGFSKFDIGLSKVVYLILPRTWVSEFTGSNLSGDLLRVPTNDNNCFRWKQRVHLHLCY